jgi:hypothetical protein
MLPTSLLIPTNNLHIVSLERRIEGRQDSHPHVGFGGGPGNTPIIPPD